MTRLILTGSKGRMGKAIAASASHFPDLTIVGEIDEGDRLDSVIDAGDVVIDFSFHSATPEIARACVAKKKAIVIGTTGHSPEERREIASHQSSIPMVWASNYSTGVNTLFWLTEHAAKILGPDFDLEILEMHHRLKKDAPSGTAASLAEILAQARGGTLDELARHGREGIVGERTPGEIGIHSLRGGDVVGDHTVIFATTGERLELTHRASSRDTFARGALRAARWVVQQKPGLYDMRDVLGLK